MMCKFNKNISKRQRKREPDTKIERSHHKTQTPRRIMRFILMQWDIYAAPKPQNEKEGTRLILSSHTHTNNHIPPAPALTERCRHENAVKTSLVIQCRLVPIEHHVRAHAYQERLIVETGCVSLNATHLHYMHVFIVQSFAEIVIRMQTSN
ncbi:hypothetical protein QQF64_020327 [Cirrhinus molitorella]|uniref:Uncharacterized protein n=1 Tax=Cirrhinus molitorella TaxID=172907 RepID=A0ABR3L911_9TELE